MTIVNPNGSRTEISDDSLVAQAYRALESAAERMGKSGYKAHTLSKFRKTPFNPSAEHRVVIQAMPDLLAGKITPEEAMCLLHEYDVLKQRTTNTGKHIQIQAIP